MKQPKLQLPALILLLILAACTPAGPEQTPPPAAPTEEPVSAPVENEMPLPSADGEPASAVTEMVVAENLYTHTDATYAYTRGKG